MQRSLLALAFALSFPALLAGQSARVAVAEEALRAAPDGVAVATLLEGTALRTGARRGDWREVTLEGWIWAASVRPDTRDGHDLAATTRENIRTEPNGNRLARAVAGMLLSELERKDGWVRIRRTGWVREAALRVEPAPAEPALPDTGAAPATPGRPLAGPLGAPVLSSPGSDTLARIRPFAPVEVLEREGEWTRVRLEGWVRTGTLGDPADAGAILQNVSAAAIAADPDAFQGRLVAWTVQFLALEQAEKIRTDFAEGEPFILARGPAPGDGLVYVAVPAEHLSRVRATAPLQRLSLVARVRIGRSRLMGAPVLDLVELR